MTLYRLVHYGPYACAALIVAAIVAAVQRRERGLTYMSGDETL